MQTTNGSAMPEHDWRQWAAFLGYVMAAALLISIALASIVLVLNVRTDVDPSAPLVAQPPVSASPLQPASLTQPGILPSQGTRLDHADLPVTITQ